MTLNDRILTTYYSKMYKILISISEYIVYTKIELHKYVLTFELLGRIENLSYKCGNLPNRTVTYGNKIY